ncbi:MAG: hypothetical protein IJX46_07360 [Clostridia bacterium]|nr:hypothetical protein [Clostridia bacterium]
MINLISIAFTVIIFVLIFGMSALGLLRGWKRSLIELVRRLCAALLAFLTAKLLAMFLPIEEWFGPVVDSILGDAVGEISSVHTFMSYLPVAIVLPFIFLILFGIYDLLLLIPAAFVKMAVLGKDKKEKASDPIVMNNHVTVETIDVQDSSTPSVPGTDEAHPQPEATDAPADGAHPEAPHHEEHAKAICVTVVQDPPKAKGDFTWPDRLAGAGIKLVTSFFVAIVCFLPLSCFLTTIGDGITEIEKAMADSKAEFVISEESQLVNDTDGNTIDVSKINSESLGQLNDAFVKPIVQNPIIAMSANPLSHALYTNLTQITVDDTRCYLDEELSNVFSLVADMTYLFVEPETYGDPQKEAVDNIIGYVSNSEFKCAIAADVLKGLGDAWARGESFMGISKPEAESAEIIVTPLIDILSKSSPEAVVNDLETIGEILILVIDYDLPPTIMNTLDTKETQPLIDQIADGEFIGELYCELYGNEDYKVMIEPVVTVFFRSLLSSFGVDEHTLGVAETPENLTREDLMEEGRLSAQMIKDGLKFIESIPDGEASADPLMLIAALDMESLGALYNNAESSVFIGEGFHHTIIAILDSPTFDNIRPICDILVSHIEKGDIDITKLLISTQQLASILVNYQNGNGSTNMLELSQSLATLITSVDEDTATVISEMLNSGAFGANLLMGGDNKVSAMLSNVITAIAGMENLSEEQLQKEAKAIDYMMKIANTATNIDSTEELKSVFEAEEDNAIELVETMLTSEISVTAINAIAYDENGNLNEDALELSESLKEEDKEQVVDSIETYYKENATEENREAIQKNINAIASIFGTDLTEDFAKWDSENN